QMGPPVLFSGDSALWLYVGCLGEAPVATAELTVGGGVVGLYNTTTTRVRVVIPEAVFEDSFKRVAGKALEFEIGPGEESVALRGPSCYREENVEMRGDLDPDLLDFYPGRISAEQVASEKARLFRQIIGRKFMIHAATSESALMRVHTDDRASLLVFIQRFHLPQHLIVFF